MRKEGQSWRTSKVMMTRYTWTLFCCALPVVGVSSAAIFHSKLSPLARSRLHLPTFSAGVPLWHLKVGLAWTIFPGRPISIHCLFTSNNMCILFFDLIEQTFAVVRLLVWAINALDVAGVVCWWRIRKIWSDLLGNSLLGKTLNTGRVAGTRQTLEVTNEERVLYWVGPVPYYQ